MSQTSLGSPIDADGHVQEPPQAWEGLEPRFRPYAPRQVHDEQGRPRQVVGGELKVVIPAPEGGWEIPAGGYDAKVRLQDMDGQGVRAAVLYPTLGLMFAGIGRTDVQVALCRAYNDWLSGFCDVDRDRLIGAALLPQRDVGESVAEARRAVAELGFRAVILRPNPVEGRTLGDPSWDPLWELLEELDVPLAVHEGTTQDLPQSGDRFENFLLRHVCSHPHEQQMACLELIVRGVLERHPALRVLFLESGCGWLPHWLERIDEHMEAWGHCVRPLPLTPTEYFQRQCFVSADPGERTIESVVSLVGDDVLLFASDYPHPDALSVEIVERIAGRTSLGEETKRKILTDNARRCFGLSG